MALPTARLLKPRLVLAADWKNPPEMDDVLAPVLDRSYCPNSKFAGGINKYRVYIYIYINSIKLMIPKPSITPNLKY